MKEPGYSPPPQIMLESREGGTIKCTVFYNVKKQENKKMGRNIPVNTQPKKDLGRW